jgi:heme-degrading monooxygenase HmoA
MINIRRRRKMHARVTIGTPKTDKGDEVAKIMRDSLPVFKKLKGFKGLLVLANRDTGKGMSITLWDTKADMTASANSTDYREGMAKVAPLFTGPPTSEDYEVAVKG